jgi:hypothetical protein
MAGWGAARWDACVTSHGSYFAPSCLSATYSTKAGTFSKDTEVSFSTADIQALVASMGKRSCTGAAGIELASVARVACAKLCMASPWECFALPLDYSPLRCQSAFCLFRDSHRLLQEVVLALQSSIHIMHILLLSLPVAKLSTTTFFLHPAEVFLLGIKCHRNMPHERLSSKQARAQVVENVS